MHIEFRNKFVCIVSFLRTRSFHSSEMPVPQRNRSQAPAVFVLRSVRGAARFSARGFRSPFLSVSAGYIRLIGNTFAQNGAFLG